MMSQEFCPTCKNLRFIRIEGWKSGRNVLHCPKCQLDSFIKDPKFSYKEKLNILVAAKIDTKSLEEYYHHTKVQDSSKEEAEVQTYLNVDEEKLTNNIVESPFNNERDIGEEQLQFFNNEKIVSVNHSMIAEFLRCPLRYKYLYQDNLVEKATKFYFRLGTALHNVLADFFREEDERKRDLTFLRNEISKRWNSDWFADKNEENIWAYNTDMILERFLSNVDPAVEVIAVELPFKPIIDGLRLTGRIDRLNRLQNGEFIVVDYKLGHENIEDDIEELQNSLQPVFYYFGLSIEHRIKPSKFVFYLLLTGKEITIDYSKTDMKTELKRIKDIISDATQRDEYPAQRNKYCQDCTYVCPLFPNRGAMLHKEA